MNAVRSISKASFKASLLLVFFFALLPPQGFAQQKSQAVDPKRLAVDVVAVHRVGRIHGIVMSQTDQSVLMVVRRDWLQSAHPEFYKQHADSENEIAAEGQQRLLERIKTWRAEYEGDDAEVINEFLDDNIKMLGLDKPADVSSFAFTILKLDREQLGRIYLQDEDRHRLAGIGWSENLKDVETTNAVVLKRKLEQQNVDVESYVLKLGNDMPPMFESDEKWEVRKALVEFALLPRVEYQGTGEMFFRRGANANPAQAIQAMMEGGFGGLGGASNIQQLGRELGLPEFRDRPSSRDKIKWIDPMIKAAEDENRRSFSVSRLTQGETVTVEMTLYYKGRDDRWLPLKKFSNSQRLADQTADEMEVVEQDPQIARVMEMAKQFGLADPNLMKKAIRSGVATKKALEDSMSELDEYVERYSFEIDNPPVE
ncbi:hypothetical protein [Mariniblastus fucicola]|uniref:Uncharacterized protein n=1 Tax=Mariniblastus fucicola TaxID=980251 RepID=A0A5B9PB22_9BACT|nr:hypothetical protein [Mariniblastus fucicola]QEG22385.1 hypothetical protein MFFC18_22650 [Mariniblastus fucicola]